VTLGLGQATEPATQIARPKEVRQHRSISTFALLSVRTQAQPPSTFCFPRCRRPPHAIPSILLLLFPAATCAAGGWLFVHRGCMIYVAFYVQQLQAPYSVCVLLVNSFLPDDEKRTGRPVNFWIDCKKLTYSGCARGGQECRVCERAISRTLRIRARCACVRRPLPPNTRGRRRRP
jgi:hypothetical protein